MVKVGIIGYGNMGSSIAEVLKRRFKVIVFDKDKDKIKNLEEFKIAKDLEDLCRESEIIIIAVKPQDFKELVLQLKNYLKDNIIVSIAAGVPLSFIEENLVDGRILRVMPNLMVKIRQSTTAITKGKNIQKKDLDLVKSIFKLMGKILIIEEELINAFTVIAGSGPAFIYYLIKERPSSEIKKMIKDKIAPFFYKASLNLGFSERQAKFLTKNIIKTSLIFLRKSGFTCDEIIKRIASKGGTTEAGLSVLAKGGSLEEAIQEGVKRARELSKYLFN